MNLRSILLSERSQTQKVAYDSIYMRCWKRQSYSNRKQRLPGNKSGLTENGHQGIFWADKNVLYYDYDDGYMIEFICLNSSNCTFKMATFYWCKLYLNKAYFKNHIQNPSPYCYPTLPPWGPVWTIEFATSMESPARKNPESSSIIQSSQMDLHKHKSNLIISSFKSPQQLLVSLRR